MSPVECIVHLFIPQTPIEGNGAKYIHTSDVQHLRGKNKHSKRFFFFRSIDFTFYFFTHVACSYFPPPGDSRKIKKGRVKRYLGTHGPDRKRELSNKKIPGHIYLFIFCIFIFLLYESIVNYVLDKGIFCLLVNWLATNCSDQVL